MAWTGAQMVADRRVTSNGERRALTDAPWVPSFDVGGVPWSTASQSQALKLPPLYAAVRHIADNIATLPLQSFRNLGDVRVPMLSLPKLFGDLATAGELVPWLTTLVSSMVLRGSAVGIVTSTDGMGFPTGITWVPLEEIQVDDSAWPFPVWRWRGVQVGADEVVHIPWITVPGRTLGLSPLEAAALTVASGVGAQEYGTEWFSNGGVPPATFKNTAKQVTQEEAETISARLVAAVRRRRPIVYGSDWEFEPITVPADQAQFIETMKLSASQIAAIYGIDPTEIGGEAANALDYKNEEHRQVTRMHNLRPWMVRIESALSARLPERQYVRFSIDAVVRADLKTRHEVYALGRSIGLYSLDELRAYEDLPPIPGGDVFAPPTPPAAPPPPPDEETV